MADNVVKQAIIGIRHRIATENLQKNIFLTFATTNKHILHFIQLLSALYAASIATLYILHLILALNRCVFVAKSTYSAIKSATIVFNNDENAVPRIERYAFNVSYNEWSFLPIVFV